MLQTDRNIVLLSNSWITTRLVIIVLVKQFGTVTTCSYNSLFQQIRLAVVPVKVNWPQETSNMKPCVDYIS